MRIFAITQKINSQRFQQNQNVTTINQAPKYDSVSFGLRKPNLRPLVPILQDKLELFRTRFMELLREGGEEAVYNFSEAAHKVDQKSRDFLTALVLSEDAQGNSFCKLALDQGRPALAECMVDFARGITDKHSQQYFVLSTNQKGHSLMQTVLEKAGTNEDFEHMAINFLDIAALVAPRSVINQKIPEALLKRGDFSIISKTIASNSGELTKPKRLAFLEKYNRNGVNDQLITWIKDQK